MQPKRKTILDIESMRNASHRIVCIHEPLRDVTTSGPVHFVEADCRRLSQEAALMGTHLPWSKPGGAVLMKCRPAFISSCITMTLLTASAPTRKSFWVRMSVVPHKHGTSFASAAQISIVLQCAQVYWYTNLLQGPCSPIVPTMHVMNPSTRSRPETLKRVHAVSRCVCMFG